MNTEMMAAIVGAVVTGVICLFGQWLITSSARAKTEGVVSQALKDIGSRQDRMDDDQTQQWATIRQHTEDIGWLRGRVGNGKTPA